MSAEAVLHHAAQHDLLVFTRLMFKARRGYRYQVRPHHRLIADALMRVVEGKTKRLIINIPPRSGKTELAVVNFIAWSLGRFPDSEFIYTSYSARLASNFSWQTRELVSNPVYQRVFPGCRLRDDSKARDEWRTTMGGIVYSVGAGGSITGYGAGKSRENFGGCFPVGTRVWTERGLIPIDRIVQERMRINVWSYDYNGNMVLRPVVGWHENPPNDIVRVTFCDGSTVECTPDHKFWTENRGWVRADSLSEDDLLPRVDSAVESADHVLVDTKSNRCWSDPFVSGYRTPLFVERIRHDDVTFCLTVSQYHNFTVESGVVVKNCIIVDDPHKADEASSDVIREGVLEWFQTTLESRKNSPDTPIIVIMQRLHERDLSGWLLAGGNGEEWEHLCCPAITETGESLWPEKWSIEDLRRMEQASPYVFAGQYLQRPAPPEGGIIKPDNIQIVDAVPAGCEFVRGWDLAASVEGDYTAGAKVGRLPDGRFVIADMVRLRAGPDDRDRALLNTAVRDGAEVTVSIPQDPGQAGLTQVKYLVRQLAGFHVKASPESGDKVVRAGPFAAQVNVGNVLMLRADWNDALISELRMFPNGANDDQVDALSRAFGELIGRHTVEVFLPERDLPLTERQKAVKESMPGLPPEVISALDNGRPDTCAACAHFNRDTGICKDRRFLVRPVDPACDVFVPL